jgi:uncharacterized protein (TIGR03437 family)
MAEVRTFAPAFFVSLRTGSNYLAAAVGVDGTPIGPPEAIPGSRAARPGEVIMLYGTGFGPTQPAQLAGAPLLPSMTSTTVTASIGNHPTMVEYSGLVLPGTYQINIRIPELANGYHAITAEIAGFKTQDKVVLVVQR